MFDLATLTLGHPEHLGDVIAGYGTEVDLDLIRAWWSLRCLSNVRWLVEHGYGPPEDYPEVAALRSRLDEVRFASAFALCASDADSSHAQMNR